MDYVEAKRLFLEYLAPGATLAFDADNRAARRLASEAGGRVAGFSTEERDADLQLRDVALDAAGAAFAIGGRLAGASSGVRLQSALLGRGHLRNAALALTYALAAGLPVERAAEVLRGLRPLRRRMERYEIAGRTILDDTAAHPDSLRGTFEVASHLGPEPALVVYALRGRRGAAINRQNALALAELCALHGAAGLIVTASADVAGQADRPLAEEVDATREALATMRQGFVWRDTLRAATRAALDATRPGSLVLLLGAQGMNEGKRLLMDAAAAPSA